MISITRVAVRDTDAKTDTDIVLADGSEIAQSSLPKNWTLDFCFSGKFRRVALIIDGGVPHSEEAPPYCPAGDNTPINLAAGTHQISIAVDTQPAEIVSFTIVADAKAVPAVASAAVFGTNGEGVLHASGDPVIHPELLACCESLGFAYLRLWTDGGFDRPFSANYWKIPLAWAAAGVKVLAVLNFQNSPGHQAPSDRDWLLKINSLPDAQASGVWGICLGNECDTSAYYVGSVNQLLHLMQLAYPILKAKGYAVIAPSMIRSLDWIKQLVAGGGLAFCDFLDFHMYESTAAAALAKADTFLAYCQANNAMAMVSECGIRGSAHDLAGWAAEVSKFFIGLKSRAGIFLQFPLCWLPGSKDPLCQMAPLGRDSKTANEPFASVWKDIVK